VGRRSRRRATPGAAPRTASAPPSRPRRARASDGLTPARRTLTRYLGGAVLVALATIIGIAALGGSLGPFVVVAYVLVSSGLLFRWAQERLAGAAMSDEDRMLQTAAGGMLLISAVLALASAVLVSVT
jgi:hypothetical protein